MVHLSLTIIVTLAAAVKMSALAVKGINSTVNGVADILFLQLLIMELMLLLCVPLGAIKSFTLAVTGASFSFG